jgi:hypothetical protein
MQSASTSRRFAPRVIGGKRFPAIGLIVLASIGLVLLLVVATTAWGAATDEQAYWRAAQRLAAGLPVYNATSVPGDASYGYWYPPPLVQVLSPLTAVLSADAFSIGWTMLLLGALWWLGGRNPLIALALIAFLPVAVELRSRNIHLVLAVLIVLALRRSWVFWVPAAAIKVAPAVGVLYLIGAGRIREALSVVGLGLVVLAISFGVAPDVWRDFFTIVGSQAGTDGTSLLAIPYPVRLAAGAALAFIAGRIGGRRGEVLVVVAVTIANPTLWVTALSLLVAIVPLLRSKVPGPPLPVHAGRLAAEGA